MKNSKKTLTNSMTLTFLSLSQNESFARQAVCAFCAQLDPTLEELSDLRIIISEAVTNCVVHAYRKALGEIFLSVKCYDDKSIHIKIRDKGCGIENIEEAMIPFYTTDTLGERSGMGFAVMQSFMDKLSVRSRLGEGVRILMTKHLK
jgi:stage II sporulation protein AB (anti-sigma F factor)